MNAKEKVKIIKSQLAKLRSFRLGCYVCRILWDKSGMTFHHIKYIPGEKTRKDFPKGYKGMLEYYIYVAPIIRKHPERFAFVCNKHHQTITWLLAFSRDKQDRLFRLVRKSR